VGVATDHSSGFTLAHCRLSFRGVLSEEELIMLEKAAAAKAEVDFGHLVTLIINNSAHRL